MAGWKVNNRFYELSVVSASVKKMLRYIYEITLVYSFELVTSLNIYKFFSNLLLVVIFSCFFGCCGKTILIFFWGETLFLFIWISFFWLLKTFLDICIIFCLFVLLLLIFLRSVTLSGITVLSSNRLNYNWKWEKKVNQS